MDTVLERRPKVAQGHAGAEQFAAVAQFSGWNPALGQRSVVEQDGEPFRIQGIGLVGPMGRKSRFHRFTPEWELRSNLRLLCGNRTIKASASLAPVAATRQAP